jgi:hypothetical protein
MQTGDGASPVAEAPHVTVGVIGLLRHHIGFTVADLDTAMSDVGEALGLRWLEPVRNMTIELHRPAATGRR